MKRIIVLIMALLLLVGCSKATNVTTYKEVIKDGKAIIDGVSYDVSTVNVTAYNYDEQGRVIESLRIEQGSSIVNRTLNVYQDDLIIEQHFYRNDVLSSSRYIDYDSEGRMTKQRYSAQGGEGFIFHTYDGDIEIQTYKDAQGEITAVVTGQLNEQRKPVLVTNDDGNKEIIFENTYDGELPVKSLRKENGFLKAYTLFEHNNLGDLILEYRIEILEDSTILDAKFYDYEYDKNMRKISMTRTEVRSPIDLNKARTIN